MQIVDHRTSRHDEKLQKIATVTALLFTQKGYYETTLDEIAQALKMSKGSIYTYVKSKQDLVFLVLEQIENTWGQSFETVEKSPKTNTAVDSLKVAVKAYISAVDEKQNEYIFLNHVIVSLDQEGRRRLLNSTRQVASKFEKIIHRGHDSGEFNNTNIETISFVITHLCSDWANNRWFLRKHMNLDGYINFVGEMAVRMLKAK